MRPGSAARRPHWDGAAAGQMPVRADPISRTSQEMPAAAARVLDASGWVFSHQWEWNVHILPFSRNSGQCLTRLWALTAEGRREGTFQNPRSDSDSGLVPLIERTKRYLKNEELCCLLLFWKSRMTPPTRKPAGLGLVILKNIITECLCNAWYLWPAVTLNKDADSCPQHGNCKSDGRTDLFLPVCWGKYWGKKRADPSSWAF